MPLSLRLKTDTAAEHERMHSLMAQADAFSNRETYARFVAAQYEFQRDVEHLFADADVKAAVPDLDGRGRQNESRADLADLGVAIPDGPPASAGVGMPEALGWLYVSEGSTLGAAFLLKEAKARLGLDENFGARNLGAYPEGRAVVWKRFTAALDTAGYDAAEQDAVIAGANAAFARFGNLIEAHFALAQQPLSLRA